MPAKNCQYCHVSAMPKKESFKPEDPKSPDVKADWLKNYPGGD